MPKEERVVIVVKKSEPVTVPKLEIDERFTNPLYRAFTEQVGATLTMARAIQNQYNDKTPTLVKRFLDQFDRKK